MRGETISRSAVVALIVVNVFELCLFLVIRSQTRLYNSYVRFPVPSGYLVDNTFMNASSAPCPLIRLSADGCPYCRTDQPLYTRIVQQAQRAGCRAIVIAPRVGQIKPTGNSGGVMQLQFVTMQFGRALNPVITPETILIDNRTGRVTWDREGSLDEEALSEGLRVLGGFR